MPRRLTPEEVVAARRDPRFQARPAQNLRRKPSNESERLIAKVLTDLNLGYEYEDRFFPTQVEFDRRTGHFVEYGFCPDFRILECPGFPEQFVEVTTARGLATKHKKIDNATRIYGIRIALVTQVELEAIGADPSVLLNLLQPFEAVAATA